MECPRLRVKDLDFDYRTITVRDGKGEKDRITILPESLMDPLQKHLEGVKRHCGSLQFSHPRAIIRRLD
jgi:integrase